MGTFGYVDHFAFWRIVGWLKKRHLGLNMHTPIRRYVPDGEISVGGVDMFRPSLFAVERYRYRGTLIPTPGTARPQDDPHQRHEHVESRMQGKLHVRFGGRAGETRRSQDGRALRSHPYTYVKTHSGGVYVAFVIDVLPDDRRMAGIEIAAQRPRARRVEMASWNRQRAGDDMSGPAGDWEGRPRLAWRGMSTPVLARAWHASYYSPVVDRAGGGQWMTVMPFLAGDEKGRDVNHGDSLYVRMSRTRAESSEGERENHSSSQSPGTLEPETLAPETLAPETLAPETLAPERLL